MEATDILAFWFGPLDAQGLAQEQYAQRWWRKDDAFDAEVRARFSATHEAAASGKLDGWLGSAPGRLAYVIVLDQLSRNMFRGSPRSFATDAQALAAARDGVTHGQDKQLIGHHRVFSYMPFMHSEALADQERCIALFTQFRDESSGQLRSALDNNIDFAKQHRDIIQRFGRFPHRNLLLGRTSTGEELEFLKQPGSSF